MVLSARAPVIGFGGRVERHPRTDSVFELSPSFDIPDSPMSSLCPRSVSLGAGSSRKEGVGLMVGYWSAVGLLSLLAKGLGGIVGTFGVVAAINEWRSRIPTGQ